MGIETIAAIGAIASAAASVAIAANVEGPPAPPPTKLDDLQLGVDDRGQHIPYVIGWRSVTPVRLYAGGTFYTTERKKSGTVVGYWHYVDACDALAMGPVSSLERIIKDGEVWWEGPLLQNVAGSNINVVPKTDAPGAFYMFFGERDQPAAPGMVEHWDYAGNLPNVAYVFHDIAFLKDKRTMPDFRYEIGGIIPVIPWISTPAVIGTGKQRSINPAHALAFMLTAPPPLGRGWKPTKLDANSFRDLAQAFAEIGVGINLLATENPDLRSIIGLMAAEIGVTILPDRGRIRATMDRDPALAKFDVPAYDISDAPRVIRVLKKRRVNRPEYQYARSAENYRSIPLTGGSNADIYHRGHVVERPKSLNLVTTDDAASWAADRDAYDQIVAPKKVTLTLRRDSSRVRRGDQITLPGIGKVRVVRTTPDYETNTAEIVAVVSPDARFGFTPSRREVATPPPALEVAPDKRLLAVDLSTTDAGLQVGLLRQRANAAVIAAGVVVETGTSWAELGDQPSAAAVGTLTAALSPKPAVWAASTVYTIGDIVRPTAAAVSTPGFTFHLVDAGFDPNGGAPATSGTSDSTEPDWSTAGEHGDEVAEGFGQTSLTWIARADDNRIQLEPADGDLAEQIARGQLPDVTTDSYGFRTGRLWLVLGDGGPYELCYAESVRELPEPARLAAEAYASGDRVLHPDFVSGVRLQAITAGTTDSEVIPFGSTSRVVGSTVVDGGVTWQVVRARYEIRRVRRARGADLPSREFLAWGAGTYAWLIAGDSVTRLSSDRLVDGVAATLATEPATASASSPVTASPEAIVTPRLPTV